MLYGSFDQFDTVTEPGWWGFPPALIIIFLIMSFNTYWARQSGLTALLFLIHHKTNELVKGTALSTIPGAGALIWMLAAMIISMNLNGMFPLSYLITAQFKFNFALSFMIWSTLLFLGWLTSPKNSASHHLPSHSPIYLAWFLLPIETISSMIRSLTLSFRLAANLTAGQVVLSLMASLLKMAPSKYILLFMASTLLYSVFELIISLVQAYVFILLISMYAKENTSAVGAKAEALVLTLQGPSVSSHPSRLEVGLVLASGAVNKGIDSISSHLAPAYRAWNWAQKKVKAGMTHMSKLYTTIYQWWLTPSTPKNTADALCGLMDAAMRRVVVNFHNHMVNPYLPPRLSYTVLMILKGPLWLFNKGLKLLLSPLVLIANMVKAAQEVYRAPLSRLDKIWLLCNTLEKGMKDRIENALEKGWDNSDWFFARLKHWGTAMTATPLDVKCQALRYKTYKKLKFQLVALEIKINAHLSPTNQKYNHMLFKGIIAFMWYLLGMLLVLPILFTGLLTLTWQVLRFINKAPMGILKKEVHHIDQLKELRWSALEWWIRFYTPKLHTMVKNWVSPAYHEHMLPLFKGINHTAWYILGVIMVVLIVLISTLKTIGAFLWLLSSPHTSQEKIEYACDEANTNVKNFMRWLAWNGYHLSMLVWHHLHQFLTKTLELYESKIEPSWKKIKAKGKSLWHNLKSNRKN